jgi:hypothetical protein
MSDSTDCNRAAICAATAGEALSMSSANLLRIAISVASRLPRFAAERIDTATSLHDHATKSG